MINFENLSAFISFVTTPNDTPTTKFYDENFKNDKSPIFKKYKEELNKHFKDSDKYKPNDDHQLYSPNGYFLFGKFDLLIFTLTDDTEFANRNFCPFPSSILDLEYKPRNFDFQVFSTLIPKIKTPKIEQNYFLEKIKKITSTDFTEKNPFIVSTQLKLNPSILIGNGSYYLNKVINCINDKISGIENIILLNLGSHELILMLFSNSTNKLSKLLSDIRELSINDLCEQDSKEKKIFLENSLLFNWQDSKEEEPQDTLSLFNNHLFVDTISNFGVHTDFFKNTSKQLDIDISNLQIVTKWFVKPGHFRKTYDAIITKLDEITDFGNLGRTNNASLTLGRGDMVINDLINFEQSNIELFIKYLNFLNTKSEAIINNIRECITSVSFRMNINDIIDTFDENEHWYSIDNILDDRCAVKPSTIIRYEEKLKKIGAPKILIEKVISICNIFNNVIQDEVLFGSFIELEVFLKIQILQKINDYEINNSYNIYEVKPKSEIINELTESCRIFESAFHDRYFQTHRTADLTDINLDYKGAIHQQLSIYDALYKYFGYHLHYNTSAYRNVSPKFRHKIYENISPQLVYISDKIGINSTKNSLKINQQHIFEPYIFLSVFLHEISNFMMDSILDNLKNFDIKKYQRYIKFFNSENYPKKCTYKPLNDNENIININKIFTSLENEIINEILLKHKDFNAYLYVDFLTYSISFNKNIEQYTYWHINYLLLQANQLHDSNHQIAERNIIMLFFRLLIVYKLSENDVSNKTFKKLYSMLPEFYFKTNSKNKESKNHFIRFLSDIRDAIDLIFKNNELNEMFGIIKEVNDDIFSEYKDKLTDINNISYDNMNEVEIENFNILVKNITTSRNNILETDYKFKLLDIIRNYIYIIHKYNGQDSNKIPIIQRDKETGIIVDNFQDSDKFADFCLDASGGIFTISAPFRKRLHLLNSSLYIALWDFTQKYKLEYF